MTGAEHYRRADELLAAVYDPSVNGTPYVDADNAALIALAQVHATLALATATAWPVDPAGATAWPTTDYGLT